MSLSGTIAIRWVVLDPTDDESILVQVMAWCCQATSHYMKQCWPRYLSPYGITRLQLDKADLYYNFFIVECLLLHRDTRRLNCHTYEFLVCHYKSNSYKNRCWMAIADTVVPTAQYDASLQNGHLMAVILHLLSPPTNYEIWPDASHSPPTGASSKTENLFLFWKYAGTAKHRLQKLQA